MNYNDLKHIKNGDDSLKLYHGSNIAVDMPKILQSDRRLDFGTGFYLTSSYEQAERWALLTTKRRGVGKQIITCFQTDEEIINSLNVLRFEKALTLCEVITL